MPAVLKKIITFFLILQLVMPANILAETTEKADYIQENETSLLEENFVRGEVIVRFDKQFVDTNNPYDLKNLQEILESKDQRVSAVLWFGNLLVIRENRLTPRGVEKMMEEYKNHPFVLHVQPNYLYKAASDNSDLAVDSEGIFPYLKEKMEEINERQDGVLGSGISIVDEKGEKVAENNENILQKNNHQEAKVTESNGWNASSGLFNDAFYVYQWALENTGRKITGILDDFVNGAPVYVEQNAIEDEDVDYEEARRVYDVAYNRLADEEKQDVIVAVIDDGVNYLHEDLQGVMWDGKNCKDLEGEPLGDCIHGYNFVTEEKDGFAKMYEESGVTLLHTHGTNIAGIIAANSKNNLGMVGVAPNVKIMALNVFDNKKETNTLHLLQAMVFAYQNGADIINFSIGEKELRDLSTFDDVDILERNIIKSFPGIFVNSAGNSSDFLDDETMVKFPSVYARNFTANGVEVPALENMIVVAADNAEGKIADFSNYGAKTAGISAPGDNVLVVGRGAYNQNFILEKYDLNSGTSFSAPMVVGALAMAKSAYPDKTLAELKEIMYATVDTKTDFADKVKSSGRLNLGRMMTRLEEDFQREILPLSGNISASTTDWTKNPVTLTLETNKNITTPEYWTKISDTRFTRVVSENTEINMAIVSSEYASQTANVKFSVKNIDTTRPTVAIVAKASTIETAEDTIAIHFTGVDAQSGIQKFQCKIDSQTWEDCETGKVVSLNKNETIFTLRSVDNAGNISTETSVTIKKVDRPNPQKTPISLADSPKNPEKPHYSVVSGAGGYVHSVPADRVSPYTHEDNKENLTLHAASSSELPILLQKKSDDIYIVTPNAEITIDELRKILQKEWIQTSKTSPVERFSIGKKFAFLEAILENLNKRIASATGDEQKSLINKRNAVYRLYMELFIDWQAGKFFIFDISRKIP